MVLAGMRHFHKFGAKQTEIDGIKFASKLESSVYEGLVLRRKAGDLIFFLRQVPFHLPGGIRYVVDFVTFDKDGSVHFIDAKGFRTREYIMKKKLVEAEYPVEIEER